MQETNQWATDCSLSLRDGPWQKNKKINLSAPSVRRPTGKMPGMPDYQSSPGGLLKTRDEAFRSGDKAALKTARANLSCGIKNAKRSHAQKINNHFTDSRDTRSLWQAIQTITDYKPLPQACDDDPSLPDTLNHFYSRFEMQNDTPAQKLPKPPNDQALCLSAADVRKTLSRINPRKAAGPDNIPG